MFGDPEHRRVDLEIDEEGTSAPFRAYMAAERAFEDPDDDPMDRAIELAHLAHSDIVRMLHQPAAKRMPKVRWEQIREGEIIASRIPASAHDISPTAWKTLQVFDEHRRVKRGQLPKSVESQ